MATVQNYIQQNYNPPMIQAIPARNWMANTRALGSADITTLCHADLIVIFRGGPGTTNGNDVAIPSGQLNVTFDLNCDQSGVNLNLQEDMGDGSWQELTPAPVLCGVGFTRILIRVNGYFFRARATRVANATTTVIWTASFTGY